MPEMLSTPLTAWRRCRTWAAGSEGALWLVLGSVFVVTYLAVIRTKPLFAPDSQYYVGMSLRFGGMSRTEAWQAAIATPLANGWGPSTEELMFGWGLVTPRVVLPVLGIPFTKAFGPYGLAVVTGLATAAMIIFVTLAVRRASGRAAAVVVAMLVMTSPLLMFFGAAMLTESLTALWAALIVLAVWRYQREGRTMHLVLAGVLTLVFAFTRQATFIVAGAFVVAWLAALLLRQDHRKWRAPALTIGATALGAQLLQMVLYPGFSQLDQYMRVTGTESLGEALRATPRLALSIIKADLNTFMVADRSLLALIVLSIVAVVVGWRRSTSHLLLGAFAGIVLYNITNGNPTQFRYAMPGLVFYALAVGGLVERIWHVVDRRAEVMEPDPVPVPVEETPTA